MGYFDWIFKYKFDNEKATLIALRDHTIGWYNDLTEPLMPVLKEIEFDLPPQDVDEYAKIAMNIFEVKIMSGHGENMMNVLESMNPRGIPFFAPRKKLTGLANEFHERGLFVKQMVISLHEWADSSGERRENVRARLFSSWREFVDAKENLVQEINHQLRALG